MTIIVVGRKAFVTKRESKLATKRDEPYLSLIPNHAIEAPLKHGLV
jgi:hypothetical protein